MVVAQTLLVRFNGIVGLTPLPHVPNETKSLAGDGADQTLLATTIVDRVTNGGQPAAERRIGNQAAVPYRLDQVVAAHHSIAIAHETVKEFEDLRLDRD